MSAQLKQDVATWIGSGRTVEAMVCDDITFLARAVLAAFWSKYPDHETEVEAEAVAALETMATVTGAPSAARLVGGAVVQSDGRMILELMPAKVEAG
jgi:hypothetical protein